jgi:hypothetical protein
VFSVRTELILVMRGIVPGRTRRPPYRQGRAPGVRVRSPMRPTHDLDAASFALAKTLPPAAGAGMTGAQADTGT